MIVSASQRTIGAGGKPNEYSEEYASEWYIGEHVSGREDLVRTVYKVFPRFPWNSFTKARQKALDFVMAYSDKYR